MKRKILGLFLLVALSGFSGCNDHRQPTRQEYNDPQARLIIQSLSDRLGGFESDGRIMDYERTARGLGYSKKYHKKDVRILADVYSYNGGIRNIPEGVKSPQIETAYKQTIDSIKGTDGKIYKDIKFITEKNVLINGQTKKMIFKREAHKATLIKGGIPLISNTFITGYMGNILKVRISYNAAEKSAGRKAVNAFMSALVRDL
ncbi:MAG: hypothetical protein ACTSXQ_06660 [Alphaproteobacteria bacterium]